MASGLTPKQARFVEEYLVDLNATQAAVRAGYSARSANSWGSKVLKTAAVAEAIAEAQAARAARTRVTADRVVKELAKVAFGDPRRLFTWGPGGVVLRDSAELSEAEAALVSEVSESKTSAGGTRRVKLHCKMAALTALARHLGLFSGTLTPPGAGETQGGEDEDESARERLARRIAELAARGGAGGGPGGAERG